MSASFPSQQFSWVRRVRQLCLLWSERRQCQITVKHTKAAWVCYSLHILYVQTLQLVLSESNLRACDVNQWNYSTFEKNRYFSVDTLFGTLFYGDNNFIEWMQVYIMLCVHSLPYNKTLPRHVDWELIVLSLCNSYFPVSISMIFQKYFLQKYFDIFPDYFFDRRIFPINQLLLRQLLKNAQRAFIGSIWAHFTNKTNCDLLCQCM